MASPKQPPTKVLLAEDEVVSRRLLRAYLERWGYEVTCAGDGQEAWSCIRAEQELELAILDCEMPRLDGVSLCRRIRAHAPKRRIYVLMCTGRDRVEDIVEGLSAGADDYLTKPVNQAELRARLNVGLRTLALERSLRQRIAELDDALNHVKRLQGLLPICMHCKRIRNKRNAWQGFERYLEENADILFSHGLCETCLAKHYPEVSAKPR